MWVKPSEYTFCTCIGILSLKHLPFFVFVGQQNGDVDVLRDTFSLAFFRQFAPRAFKILAQVIHQMLARLHVGRFAKVVGSFVLLTTTRTGGWLVCGLKKWAAHTSVTWQNQGCLKMLCKITYMMHNFLHIFYYL